MSRPVLVALVALTAACGGPDRVQELVRLGELPTAPTPTTVARPPGLAGSSTMSLAEYVAWLDDDLESIWSGIFARGRARYARPGLVAIAPAETASSTCARSVAASAPPFYCWTDATMYLPLEWLAARSQPVGDFATAFTVAHEWGHHVQNLLGLPRLVLEARGRIRNVDVELQADCLAGVWAATLYARGTLEPGDIDEAIRFASTLADHRGIRVTDPHAHGTARQRREWFSRGYRTRRADRCRTWPR